MWKATSTVHLLCTAAFMLLSTTTAISQTAANYPGKPVRIVLPYAPGGAATAMTRAFADKLSKDLGQIFIVDNRPGGNTIIGTEAVVRAAPDGYTLLVVANSLLVNHWTQPNLPYDTLKDLAGISTLIRNDHMIAVHKSVPANTLNELIAYAQKNPGKINSVINGLGTNNHLENLLFMQATDTKFTMVPYKGGGAAIADLLSGYVQMSFNSPSLFLPHIKAGTLKGIAISGDSRNPVLPDLPTFAEAGLTGFIAGNWYILFAPAATPRDIIEKLNVYVGRAQASNDVQELLARAGVDPYPNSVAVTNALLGKELEGVGRVIRENNIKAVEE